MRIYKGEFITNFRCNPPFLFFIHFSVGHCLIRIQLTLSLLKSSSSFYLDRYYGNFNLTLLVVTVTIYFEANNSNNKERRKERNLILLL